MLTNARRLTLVLGALFLVGVLSFLYVKPAKLASLYNLVPNFESQEKPHSPKYRDSTLGSWIPSPGRASDADVWNMPKSCSPDFSPAAGGPDGRDEEAEARERGRHVASWEWVLQDGKPPRPWDTEAFIERALKSRGGFVFIGGLSTGTQIVTLFILILFVDSVMLQMLNGLQHFVGQHVGEWPRTVVEQVLLEDNGIYITVSHITLHPENQLFAKLLGKPSLAGVPRSRFSRPIITSYRSDDLITQKELNATLLMAGMEEPVNMNNHRAMGDWRQGLKNNSMEESWEGELDTIVFANTGPHWSPAHMFPATDRVLLKGYQIMLDKVYDFFINSPLPTLTFFRATSPAHQHCNNHSDPITLTSSSAINPAPEEHLYGWHLFPEYNRMARELFGSSKHNNTRYFDIWPLSVMRPDAHIGWHGNNFDCLHVRPFRPSSLMIVQLTSEFLVVSTICDGMVGQKPLAHNCRRGTLSSLCHPRVVASNLVQIDFTYCTFLLGASQALFVDFQGPIPQAQLTNFCIPSPAASLYFEWQLER